MALSERAKQFLAQVLSQVSDPRQVAAQAVGAVPGIGDIAGIGGDVAMYATQPESRNWLNYALTAASALPFVPAVSQIGKRLPEAPRAEALRQAEGNAVKMLGLPPGNTSMDRARAMGYTVPGFHGTMSADITEFDRSKLSPHSLYGPGVYITQDPNLGSSYAMKKPMPGQTEEVAGNVIPVLARNPNVLDIEGKISTKEAAKIFDAPAARESIARVLADKGAGIDADTFAGVMKEKVRSYGKSMSGEQFYGLVSGNKELMRDILEGAGYTGLTYQGGKVSKGSPHNVNVVLDPSNVRSRFAAFDPARIKSRDLLASALLASPLAARMLYEPEQEEVY